MYKMLTKKRKLAWIMLRKFAVVAREPFVRLLSDENLGAPRAVSSFYLTIETIVVVQKTRANRTAMVLH